MERERLGKMNQELVDFLKEREISKQTAADFNLCLYGEKTVFLGESLPLEKYATRRHRGSIIFPVQDVHGELVCISSKKPSMRNYLHRGTKTQTLYGLYTTWPYIIRKNIAYIVEGNFDILMLYEKGIKNVVSLLGAHANYSQLCLLRRFTSRVILALDGDKAGRAATLKLIPELEELDFEYRTVHFEEEEDPDSFLKKHSRKELKQLIH